MAIASNQQVFVGFACSELHRVVARHVLSIEGRSLQSKLPDSDSSLALALLDLADGKQQRILNFCSYVVGDVAVAVKAIDEELVGVIVLLQALFLPFAELPVMADIAVLNDDSSELLYPCFAI